MKAVHQRHGSSRRGHELKLPDLLYYNLKHKRYHASGGHIAAWEEPQAIITDVRDFFHTLS